MSYGSPCTFPITLKISREKASCIFHIHNFQIHLPLQTLFQFSEQLHRGVLAHRCRTNSQNRKPPFAASNEDMSVGSKSMSKLRDCPGILVGGSGGPHLTLPPSLSDPRDWSDQTLGVWEALPAPLLNIHAEKFKPKSNKPLDPNTSL